MKHTQGPWKVEEYRVNLGGGSYNVIGNNSHEIAYTPLRTNDARLIAAAPEMYDILRELQTTIKPYFADEYLKITLLLARIEGRQ